MGRDEYGIFENEHGQWFIDDPEQIYGPYDSLAEAEEEFDKWYPDIDKYVIIPYSEMTEWIQVDD